MRGTAIQTNKNMIHLTHKYNGTPPAIQAPARRTITRQTIARARQAHRPAESDYSRVAHQSLYPPQPAASTVVRCEQAHKSTHSQYSHTRQVCPTITIHSSVSRHGRTTIDDNKRSRLTIVPCRYVFATYAGTHCTPELQNRTHTEHTHST